MSHVHLTRDPDIIAHVNRPPEARTITVIAVTFRRGEGCCDRDPVRECIAYYSPAGELLAEHDPSPTVTEVAP